MIKVYSFLNTVDTRQCTRTIIHATRKMQSRSNINLGVDKYYDTVITDYHEFIFPTKSTKTVRTL